MELCRPCSSPAMFTVQRLSTLKRAQCVVVRANKGFSGPEQTKTPTPAVKVNERGKVSSRPGVPSAKQLKMQKDIAQAQEVTPLETSSLQPPVRDEPPVMETPQVVVDRMFSRMVACAGLPVFIGILCYPLFYYLKVVQEIDVPMWVVYMCQYATFGGGLLGITYGIMSTSWDPTREGSFWGWTEFQANLPIMLKRKQ